MIPMPSRRWLKRADQPLSVMADDNRARLKQWLESGEARLHPLTLPQRELWEASPVPVGDVANHICAFIEVKGAISRVDCDSAIERVVERQEVLRLSILPGKAQPVQMVRSTRPINMAYRELTPSQRTPEGLEEAMQEVFLEPFDLARGPLYRIVFLQRGPGDLVMVFAIHHTIADGWTLGVFVQDLVAAYIMSRRGGKDPLPPVPLAYSAWGAADRAFWTPEMLAEKMTFWKPRLSGAQHLWTAPDDLTKAAGPLRRHVSMVPPELTTAVRELARTTGTTLFSTLLTAFQWTLARWSGKNDITVGSPVANRTKPNVRETMGSFAGNVPLRGQVETSQTFAATLRQSHADNMDAFAHAMPFVELVRLLGDQAAEVRHPVYSVRFALQNHPVPDVSLPGLVMKLRMRSTGTARFDLGCEVTEDGTSLEVVWLFRPSLFSQADVDTLDGLFRAVLTKVCDSPETRASSV